MYDYPEYRSVRLETDEIFGGRAGEDRHFDMDAVIALALEIYKKEPGSFAEVHK